MKKTYTALFPFCGLGGGARGFLDAEARVLGAEARFRSVGGIDNDPEACKDFVYLTDSPALCADVATMTAEQLRDFAGERAGARPYDGTPEWLAGALASVTRTMRHPGNHKYAWALDRRMRSRLPPSTRYPKLDSLVA